MKRWEHRVVDVAFNTIEKVEAHLNLLGSQGYELVSVVRGTAYLKREKAPQEGLE